MRAQARDSSLTLRVGRSLSERPARIYRVVRITALAVFFAFLAPGLIFAQTANVTFEISSDQPRITVSGDLPTPASAWSFRNTYGLVAGLGARIRNLTVLNDSGNVVRVTKSTEGEYRSEAPARRFSYEVIAGIPKVAENGVFASWVSADRALLLLGDLVPLAAREARGVRARFNLPAGWKVSSAEQRRGDAEFEVNDVAEAVFVAGTSLRDFSTTAAGISTTITTAGEWSFEDREFVDLVNRIVVQHSRVLDPARVGRAAVFLLPFPVDQPAQRWSAETRGHTVILLSGRQPSKPAALAQLSVSLTHELMHLWVPNALNLEGNYDWFYEGFTLYQALRTGMELGFFSFQDYLNALGRAFDAYQSEPDKDGASLTGLSEKRWAGAQRLLYNKGMLVAFLYDLSLRSNSGGKQSLDDVYRLLIRLRAGSVGPANGNSTVVGVLSSLPGMREFVQAFIEGHGSIELGGLVDAYGLVVTRGPVRTQVAVSDKLKGRQKALLKKLGYNEMAR